MWPKIEIEEIGKLVANLLRLDEYWSVFLIDQDKHTSLSMFGMNVHEVQNLNF